VQIAPLHLTGWIDSVSLLGRVRGADCTGKSEAYGLTPNMEKLS